MRIVRRTISLTIVLMLFGLSEARSSEASTYYVAKTGNDSNSCAQVQSVSGAKLTIAAGLSCLRGGGDTLIIKAGTYAEHINYNQIPSGTSEGARTTIRAATGETVIIQPTVGTPRKGTGHAIWIYGKHYVTVDGLVVDAANVSGGGIHVSESASFIRIQNMEVKNAPGNCIAAQVGDNVEIINSKIHDCGKGRPAQGIYLRAHGIYLRGNNHLVERNEIYNIAGHGVHQWSRRKPNDNNIVRYNYIHDNGSRGILIGSGNNNAAYGNVLRNNGIQSGQGGITIGYHGTDNNQAYDNEMYSNRGSCVVILKDSTNSIARNNVCWQNGNDAVRDQGSLSGITNTRVSNPLSDKGNTGADLQFSK